MRSLIALFTVGCALAGAADQQARYEARWLLFAGLYKQAAAQYRELLAADPGWGEGYDGLVRALLAAKKTREAYQVFAEALKRAPNTAGAQTVAGRVMFRGGEFKKAGDAFDAALKLDPRYAGAVSGAALLAACTSRFQTAERLTALAHELAPGDPEAIIAWADTLEDRAERIKALQQAFAIYHGSEPAGEVAHRMAVEKALAGRRTRVLQSPYQRYELKLGRLGVIPTEFSPSQLPKGFALRVQFNAGPPLQLLLDTHPRGILINRKAAVQAGLERLDGNEYMAREVGLGGLSFSNFPVSVRDPQGLALPYDGYLGSDVLEQFLVTIDFPNAVLTLDPFPGEASPPAARAADAARPLAPGFTEFFRLGDLLMVPVAVKGEMPRVFSVDSTNPVNLITDGRAAPAARLDDNGGARSELAFGDLGPQNVRALRMNRREPNDAAGTEVAGSLGLPVLIHLKLTIDYRNGAVAFHD